MSLLASSDPSTPDCRYMRDGECRNRLALPVTGPRPSRGVCGACAHRDGLRGAGDAVKWLLSWTPLRAVRCGGDLWKAREFLDARAGRSPVQVGRPIGGCGNPEHVVHRGPVDAGVARHQGLTAVEKIAREELPEGVPMAQWALAWCLRNPVVSAVIPGCKDPAQTEANARAADLVS